MRDPFARTVRPEPLRETLGRIARYRIRLIEADPVSAKPAWRMSEAQIRHPEGINRIWYTATRKDSVFSVFKQRFA